MFTFIVGWQPLALVVIIRAAKVGHCCDGVSGWVTQTQEFHIGELMYLQECS